MVPPVQTMLPFLTADLPGIGGVLKHIPEDFVVEEIPLYEPSGDGEHLFLWIEKRDVSAESLVQHLAGTLGIGRGDVGVAGLKDRRAITRQFVSVPGRCVSRLGDANRDGVTVLRATKHGNKLKTGHLKGNRFDMLVRDASGDAAPRAAQIADVIRQRGFPNYYGEQRFGHAGETLRLGLDLITGRKSDRDIPRNRRKFLVRLSLSAVQSAIFNEVVSRRIDDGLLHRVLPGDVMQVRASGGPFVAEDVGREQERFEQGETVISGPMFGVKMRQPMGEVAAREQEALAVFGLSPGNFAAWRKLLPGTRRPLIAFAEGLESTTQAEGIRFSFALSRGTYATSMLREFTKDSGMANEASSV